MSVCPGWDCFLSSYCTADNFDYKVTTSCQTATNCEPPPTPQLPLKHVDTPVSTSSLPFIHARLLTL
ncbi:hypothetical protein XENOCAPTIV_013435 [Xenoophorus captivus]|uniref:Uncharacterized protein n=1 Tax=Xenoophorus captivus TaxID=1517983 RepID=A0ABV0S2U3_9TELE